jgi:alkanesulfonate monooxygenase SsuD/methylene tetrahydromethanopterin reductase-like flavin-dependent oxidoreductase (luciferase family)
MVTSIGVMLPISDPLGVGTADIPAAARHLEQIGADTVWAGDHLAFHTPLVEPTVTLATAAAVTERVRLGFGVLLLALRQPAWAAKQISSLQAVSGGRVVLGVGVGGENPEEWEAAGIPLRERARRTDAILSVLPQMLSGTAVTVPAPYDLPVPALGPTAGVPPLWIGGRSDEALRRAVRFADGWLGMWADERRVLRAREQLQTVAAQEGRAVPRTGLHVFVHVEDGESGRAEAAAFVTGQYQLPFEKVERYVALGSVGQVTEQLAGLLTSGVDELLLHPATGDHRVQYDRLGSVLSGLREVVTTR